MTDIDNLSQINLRSAVQGKTIINVTEMTGIAAGGPVAQDGTDTLIVMVSPVPEGSRIPLMEKNDKFEVLGLRLRKRRRSRSLEIPYRFKGDPLDTNKAAITVELYDRSGALKLRLNAEQTDIRAEPPELSLVSANAVLTRMDHNRAKFRLAPKDLKNLAAIRLIFERI